MSTQRSLKVLAAVAVLGLGAAAGSASAQESRAVPDVVSVRVGYTDLDLDTAAGARQLLHRLHGAARAACGDTFDDLLDGGSQRDACVHEAVDRAVAIVDHPVVTAMNGGRGSAASVNLAASRP